MSTTTETAAAPAAKERIASMTTLQKLALLAGVKDAPANQPDNELAAAITLTIGREVTAALVKRTRESMGLASVKADSREQIAAKLSLTQAQLADARALVDSHESALASLRLELEDAHAVIGDLSAKLGAADANGSDETGPAN